MKIFLVRRRHLMLAAGALLTFALFCVVNAPTAVQTSVATRQLPIYCVDRSDKTISISFDAAWGAVILRQLLLLPDSYHGGNTMNCVEFW